MPVINKEKAEYLFNSGCPVGVTTSKDDTILEWKKTEFLHGNFENLLAMYEGDEVTFHLRGSPCTSGKQHEEWYND